MLNVMHAREQCDEFIFYIEHLRFRLHCSGQLHLEFYGQSAAWNSQPEGAAGAFGGFVNRSSFVYFAVCLSCLFDLRVHSHGMSVEGTGTS
jgi:hypothetical protein